ncbi:MAG: hypothetical protein NZL93_02105, partial [Chthoniobacterales bacterium]|nr:hypothetical protein [Chthoniobacterales bacterium]
MKDNYPLVIFSEASSEDPLAAAKNIAKDLGEDCQAALFFTSSLTKLEVLGKCLNDYLPCPVVGCTTAGEIIQGLGYCDGRIVAVGFPSPELSFEARLLKPLHEFCKNPDEFLGHIAPLPLGKKRFVFVLLDGLSGLEESALTCLTQYFQGIPIVGGSAGDNLRFNATYVYYDGEFHTGAGLALVFDTSLYFEVLHVQNIVPSNERLVITEADSSSRLVYEINGRPAALEYARLLK